MGILQKYFRVLYKTIPGRVLMLVFLSMLYSGRSSATHLVGGSITYKYLGVSNSKLMFRITVDMYRDCSNSAGAFFDPNINISVYERKANSFGDTAIIDTLIIRLASYKLVEPPSSAKNCTVKPNTCLQEGLYNDTLLVNPSSYGYYLETQRCCRNTMLNVPDNVGQTYFAIIPPTNIINNTPVFNAVPSPYLCAYDTVSLNYSAYEPDGDSLVYRLGWPFAGGNATNLIIPPPAAVFSPVPLVPYNFGYSPPYPLGKTGYADIDMFTGVLTIYAPAVGRFAIAVDVYEYRNKKVISVTRRDVQLITVSGCPKTPAPVRVPIIDSLPLDNTTATSYTVQSGHRISFNIRYKAYNSAVTQFSATGFFNQPGIFTYQPTFVFKLDSGWVTAYLNWQTTCTEGRTIPYTFTVAVSDTGCPAKTKYEGYKIFVHKGSDHISGVAKFCSDTPKAAYATNPPIAGDTLYWKVTGGKIIKKLNDSSILVKWQSNTTGLVQVMTRNDKGCVSDTVSFLVKISARPKTPAIIGPDITCPGIINTYTTDGYKKLLYGWRIKGGTIVSSDNMNKQIQVLWDLNQANMLWVTGIDSVGCSSDTAKIVVNTKKTSDDTIFGESPVCPNTSGLNYFVHPKAGGVFFWKVEGGTQVSGGNSNRIRINWGNKGNGIVKVFEQVPGQCPGDTIQKPVLIDYNLVISPVKGDSVVCSGSKGIHYTVSGIPTYVYQWTVSNGTITEGNGTPDIYVNWDKAGAGHISVKETSYDTISRQVCASQTVYDTVTINPVPDPSMISGPTDICENDSALYKVSGSLGNYFTWKINGVISPVTADSIFVGKKDLANEVDTIHLEVSENSAFHCPGPWRMLKIRVHKLPVTSGIKGTAHVCSPDMNGAEYKVKGFKNSTYKWVIDGGVITNGDQSDSITVNWLSSGKKSVSVQEINSFGCTGPAKIFYVSVDSLALDIDLVTTGEADEKVIDVFWSVKNDIFFDGYFRIYRSVQGQPWFRLIDSVPKNQTWYVDKKVNTAAFAYRYRIEAVNSCGKPVKTTIHRTVNLTGYFDKDTTIRLIWNSYTGWPVDKYSVNESKNGDTTMEIFGLTGDTGYVMIKTLEGYRECFRIAAKKAALNNVISWSNKVCFDFDPILWIPDVFTPNGDPHNNTFHVFVSNHKTYRIDIYNRWGEHIFTSTDPKIQWDGRFKGSACSEGVYLYMVNVGGAKNDIYRSGTVTLLR